MANGFWRLERSTGAIEHGFLHTKTRGIVSVDYEVKDDAINVVVDPTGLGPGCTRLSVMNELDAQVFDSYEDSSGSTLRGWRVVP